MVAAVDPYRRSIHPLHAILLAGAVPLFLGVLLNDIAYSSSYQIQWKNFASWLLVGALVFSGLALLWGIVDLFRAERRGSGPLLYVLLVLATWVVGFINALVHAKDAWASMPTGLVLSVIAAVLILAATWLGFFALSGRELVRTETFHAGDRVGRAEPVRTEGTR